MAGTNASPSTLTPLHWLAVVTALVSAGVHLVLGIEFLPHWMGISFLLATGGFVGGVALFFANVRRPLLYLLGIPFTASQIVAWIVLGDPGGAYLAWEAVDKVAQVLLIGALVVLYRRES